jgi:hypothetical protein
LTNDKYELNSKHQFKIKSYKSEAYIEWEGIKNAVVNGDILLQIFHRKVFGGKVTKKKSLNIRKKSFSFGLTLLFLKQAACLLLRRPC